MKVWELADWGVKNLRVADREIPAPGAHEVLVRVRAASLNYRDKPTIEGQFMPEIVPMPLIPASDFGGEIAAVGSAATRFKVGDRVSANFYTEWLDGAAPEDLFANGATLGLGLQGVLAEYVVVPEAAIVKAPASLSMEEIATLPIAGLTAWCALVDLGQVKPGQTVLTHGTGGVSLFAVQFARMIGARAIVTSRNPDKLKRAAALGATDTVDTSADPNWAPRVRQILGGRGVEHVIETLGGNSMRQSLSVLAMGGRITVIGFLEAPEFTLPAVPIMIQRSVLQGQSVGPRRAFEEMNRAIELNKLKPAIDRVYDWKDVPAAFAHIDRGPFGKIVISINP